MAHPIFDVRPWEGDNPKAREAADTLNMVLHCIQNHYKKSEDKPTLYLGGKQMWALSMIEENDRWPWNTMKETLYECPYVRVMKSDYFRVV